MVSSCAWSEYRHGGWAGVLQLQTPVNQTSGFAGSHRSGRMPQTDPRVSAPGIQQSRKFAVRLIRLCFFMVHLAAKAPDHPPV